MQVSGRVENSKQVANANTRLVLDAVRTMGPTFRAEVARKTQLNPATVTGIVNDLLQRDLLLEIPDDNEDAGTRSGRPPQLLQVNANSRDILAIDLEPDRVRVSLMNLMLVVREYRERTIDRFSRPELIIQQVLELCREARDHAGHRPLQGVGVSLPGLVDMASGVLLGSTNMPKMVNVPIREVIEREFDVPVHIERSMHLASLYEKWIRSDGYKGCTIVLTLRTGVGFSLISNGELHMGESGYDGEIGHTVVDMNGEPCECGGTGCLETYVGAAAICRRVQQMYSENKCESVRQACDAGEELSPELVYRLAKAGDEDCAQIVREIGRYIGIAVSNMINVLAPGEVVICGSIDTCDELILESVQSQIHQRALPRIRENVVVRLAVAKDRTPLFGAGVLVAKRLFEIPSLTHAI